MDKWVGLGLVALVAAGCGGDDTTGNQGGGSTTVPGAAGTFAPPAGTGGGAGTLAASGGGAGTLSSGGVAGTLAAGTAGAPVIGGNGGASATAGNGGTLAANGGMGAAGMVSAMAGSGGGGSSPPSAGSGGGEVPITGTFPKIEDPESKGPFMAVTVNNTGPSRGYTLFHPMELAPEGVLNPVVTWGNGGFTTPVDYEYLLPHLASHGFVIIASNNTTVTGPEVRAGLDWIAEQNKDESSPFYQKLDIDNASGIAYSNGGLATLSVADDPRYVTIVIISGANVNDNSRTTNTPKLHTPVAYLCTADDSSKANCANDFAAAKVPAFFGVMNGSNHFSVTEIAGLGDAQIMTRLAGATTAWLRWQQMADQSFKPKFVGADCGLCKDANWTVEPQKDLN